MRQKWGRQKQLTDRATGLLIIFCRQATNRIVMSSATSRGRPRQSCGTPYLLWSRDFQKGIKKGSKNYQKSIKNKKVSKNPQNCIKKVSKNSQIQKAVKNFSKFFQKAVKNLSNYKKVSKSCQTCLQKGVKKISNFWIWQVLVPFLNQGQGQRPWAICQDSSQIEVSSFPRRP